MCNILFNNRLSLWIWFFYNIILWMGSKAFGVDFLLFLRRGKAFFLCYYVIYVYSGEQFSQPV